jgi:hypothetical protein
MTLPKVWAASQRATRFAFSAAAAVSGCAAMDVIDAIVRLRCCNARRAAALGAKVDLCGVCAGGDSSCADCTGKP